MSLLAQNLKISWVFFNRQDPFLELETKKWAAIHCCIPKELSLGLQNFNEIHSLQSSLDEQNSNCLTSHYHIYYHYIILRPSYTIKYEKYLLKLEVMKTVNIILYLSAKLYVHSTSFLVSFCPC